MNMEPKKHLVLVEDNDWWDPPGERVMTKSELVEFGATRALFKALWMMMLMILVLIPLGSLFLARGNFLVGGIILGVFLATYIRYAWMCYRAGLNLWQNIKDEE